jgi:phosphoribosylglycinamide formyltransferase 1
VLQIAVFASGRGSNLEALYRAIVNQNISAKIVAVISNNSNAGALLFARSLNIPAIHISQKQFPTQDLFTEKLLETLLHVNANFIVLAGYMKKIDARIIAAFRNRIINIHPALLPKFGGDGMFGHHVHKAVIEAKENISGATVHLVDEDYDRGPIILQDSTTIEKTDTEETLAAKVLAIEHTLLPKVVRLFSENKISFEQRNVHIIS